jgi:hypothetical protein
MKQLAFTLLELIQLGDVIPHYHSVTRKARPGRHEVHDRADTLLISSCNAFD